MTPRGLVKGHSDLAASAAYEPEPAAAAAARRFVRETLHSWHVADRSSRLVDDVVLLTSELVTNAIVHAGTRLQVSCRLDGGEVEVAVRDRHPARTIRDVFAAGDDAERTNGRGLLLPAALASSWGVSYARTAKAVWFRMALKEKAAESNAAPRVGTREAQTPEDVTREVSICEAHTSEAQTPTSEAQTHTSEVQTRISELETYTPEAPPRASEVQAHTSRGQAHTSEAQIASGPGEVPWYAAPPADPGADGAVPMASDDEVIAGIGRLSYDELLRHTVEMARDVAGADAVYALVADEDGELRMRAGAGIAAPELLARFAGPIAQVAQVPHADPSSRLPAVYNEMGQFLAEPAATPLPEGAMVTVPFLAEGRVTGMLAAAAAERNSFSSADIDRLQRLADRVALSLERARLTELERTRRGRISFLAEASDLLAGTLDQHKTIALAAQLVVPRLASWCAVYLADDGGPPTPAYVWHCDETYCDALTALLARMPPPEVPPSGGARQWSLPRAQIAPWENVDFAADAVWCCPLVARGRALGAFVIGRPAGDRFPREAIEMVEDLGRRAALALDNARLYSQQLQTSQALQRSLLPPEVPKVRGVDLAVEYTAAGEGNEVGGDFYDLFTVADGRWRFSIGDVCGTGPQAAAVTGLARYTMRILAREGRGIAAVLDRLNRLILDEGPRARFLTLVHGEITSGAVGRQRGTGSVPRGAGGARSGAARSAPGRAPAVRVSLVCAGHPPPLLMRAGEKPELAVSSQPLLGVLDQVSFRAKSLRLYSGDVLLCVTDGLTERRHAGRLFDDDDGLRQVFATCGGLNAGGVAARIMRAVRGFAPEPPADDMALIVMRVL